MSTAPSKARVSALEATRLELARAQVRTERSVDRLAKEMRVPERKMEAQRVESNKRWGELDHAVAAFDLGRAELLLPSMRRRPRGLVAVQDKGVRGLPLGSSASTVSG